MSTRVEVPEIYLYSNWKSDVSTGSSIFVPKYEQECMRKLVVLFLEMLAKNQPIINELHSRDLFKAHQFLCLYDKRMGRSHHQITGFENSKRQPAHSKLEFGNFGRKFQNSNIQTPRRNVHNHRRVRTMTSINSILGTNDFGSQSHFAGISESNVVSVSSINAFLNDKGVKFDRKDVFLLFNFFGDFSGRLSRESFCRFFRVCSKTLGN